MKKNIYLLTLLLFISFFNSCDNNPPPHHPKHPNYDIIKPSVKYLPSKQNLGKMVKDLQGSPYVWAEEGPNTFDCSGFTYYMYGSMGIELPRVAREQAKVGKRIKKKDLQYGDLIFFATNKTNHRKITHVGMYLGDGWFTHASTVTHEVVYSNLDTSNYYKRKLRICRRYLPNEKIALAKKTPIWKKSGTFTNIKPFKTTNHNVKKRREKQGKFYIQVGSFSGYPSASLLHQIKSLKLHYKIIKFNTTEELISKLLIGPFKTRDKALLALPKVQDYLESSAYIVQIR